jgi:hypothetical protein
MRQRLFSAIDEKVLCSFKFDKIEWKNMREKGKIISTGSNITDFNKI